jgi:hypothetical protein
MSMRQMAGATNALPISPPTTYGEGPVRPLASFAGLIPSDSTNLWMLLEVLQHLGRRQDFRLRVRLALGGRHGERRAASHRVLRRGLLETYALLQDLCLSEALLG